jgi:ABC-type multidrug transport system fused ATPase/permease subunit
LDDILSAVDAHVGSFLFKETIKGYLKSKTVLLITHSLYFVKHTDRIFIFEDGRIIQQGTYDELQHTDILLEV